MVGQEETQDQQLLNSWFQTNLLPVTVTLAVFEQYDSQCTQTSQNTECPVSYSVNLLFNYIFLNIYLFVKNTVI